MNLKEKQLKTLHQQISHIIEQAQMMEIKYSTYISNVAPTYRKSALNLVHYLAMRQHQLEPIQNDLRNLGMPALENIEAHVMKSLLAIITMLNHLLGNPTKEKVKGIVSIKKSRKILDKNTKALLGYKPKKRRTRIMVTMPSTAADSPAFLNHLLTMGMNCIRINCAHDTPETWEKIAQNAKSASLKKKKKCKIMMDLGGPKLRTGPMKPGPKIIHIKPERNKMGKLVKPAQIWIAPPTVLPPKAKADYILPIAEEWMQTLKKGDIIKFIDSRGKTCQIEISKKAGTGRWAQCSDSAYIASDTHLMLHKPRQKGDKIINLGDFQALEQSIILNIGDKLELHREPLPGEPAQFGTNGNLIQAAHISCTLPEVFRDVKVGEPIMFDDGKIEGLIESCDQDKIVAKIINAKEGGSKLRQYKGINLPESKLQISGLTEKDKEDLPYVAKLADTVNLSFVNSEKDVVDLLIELKKLNADLGLILKIETQKGFNDLPKILLTAMQSYPIGVMIARGDLAIETGWKNIAGIQEEIIRICEAAHVPDIWATQVLENLSKKGIPSRAEITDAAMAQRAECVMLNKGYYIFKAVKLLDKILRKMQKYNSKRKEILPQLNHASNLSLEQENEK
jgi:pyruvate kinase